MNFGARKNGLIKIFLMPFFCLPKIIILALLFAFFRENETQHELKGRIKELKIHFVLCDKVVNMEKS